MNPAFNYYLIAARLPIGTATTGRRCHLDGSEHYLDLADLAGTGRTRCVCGFHDFAAALRAARYIERSENSNVIPFPGTAQGA